MKKSLLFSIILSLWYAGNLLQAQQWHYYNPTAWFDINTVEIPGPGIIVVGGGQETRDSVQVMFQSSDYGLTWYENYHDGLAPWNKSVAFSDSLNGYGVGYDGRIIRSDDAGRNWGHTVYPINRDLNKIVYAGAGTYYVAGGNKSNDSMQTILKSINNGNSWSVIFDTLGPWLKSIFFKGTLRGFAIGENGVILSTTNGGNTWSPIAAPVQRDFNAITFINNDTGYIVGGIPQGLCRRTILRTVNGGLNWSVLLDTAGGILKDVSFADDLVGYSVGDSATVLETIDGGLNWLPTIIDSSLTGNETFNAVKLYSRNFGAIGGKSGLLYVYQDGPVELYTFGISQIGNTDATLQGEINTHSSHAKYSFVYTNNISFLSSVSTPEVNIQNNSLITVSEYIQGLVSNTTYYYFLKATTTQDTIHGDTLSFVTGINPPYSFLTLDANEVSTGGSHLKGFINKFPEPVNLFFEYSTSPAFGSQIAAVPASVNDTLMHYIDAHITPLLVNEHYFFRLKGVTPTHTYYGDTKTFYAVNQPYVRTEEATNITISTAQLNATANANSFPCTLKFEYGLTYLYGTEINSIPDSLTGSNNVNATCVIGGLSPLMTYHFRVKAISSQGTSYGRDMTFRISRATAITLPATIFGASSVQLNGTVNNNNIPAAIKFEYGPTALYGTEVNSSPDSAIGTGILNASSLLNGLSTGITYHFRIKATNSVGISYGEDKTFNTGIPSVTTCQASNMGITSAQLNGIVGANNFPTAIKFIYGLTSQYGSEMDAVPDSVTGLTPYSVSYTLTGLSPYTIYHYCVKASNSNGTVYGADVSFNTGAATVSTLSASNITVSSAQLNGIVNANYIPTANKFEYGTSPNYGNEVPAIPDSATGHIDVNISYQLYGLLPNTTYFFRVKAINPIGEAYGNNMVFITGSNADSLVTLPANDITPNSARLNGSVDAGGISTAVSFEYGTTITYGNEINAVPDSAYNVGSIDVYASPAGLQPNTTYHFRLKGVTSSVTNFGEDMMFYTGTPEIPNFDFENWTSFTFTKPEGWDVAFGRVSRITTACYNNYAVKIENSIVTEGEPGTILIGGSNDQGHTFIGGTPFNARPDTLTGCFNYSIQDDDTALVLLILKKQGLEISNNWFKIFGNSSGNYVDLKFPIKYTSAGNADSLIIGLVTTNIRNMTIPLPIESYLIVDNIRFSGTTENIPNNDFENWITSTYYKIQSWYYPNMDILDPWDPINLSLLQTTDAQHGNYAALIQNLIYPEGAIPGFLSTCRRDFRPGFSVNGSHQSLTGYYKFLPENNDTMTIYITMYKNHNQVGWGNFQTSDTKTNYTPFLIKIHYNDTVVVPDSGQINIQASWNRPMGNSRLYIDNLNFDGYLSEIKEPVLNNGGNFDVNIFPNPFNEKATVSFTVDQEKNVTVRLFDISGKQVTILLNGLYKPGEYKINLSASGLGKGFYLCVINCGDQVISRKLVIY